MLAYSIGSVILQPAVVTGYLKIYPPPFTTPPRPRSPPQAKNRLENGFAGNELFSHTACLISEKVSY